MNKKTMVVVIGLVLSLSMISISTMILPVRATVSVSAPGSAVSINPIIVNNGGSTIISEPSISIDSIPFNIDDPIYDLLIIAPAKFSAALQPLVNHKNNFCGVETILVTTSEIYDGDYFPVQGGDDPEKIKYFIKNAYDEWGIKYVLLVGGRASYREWLVPVRYCYNEDLSMSEFLEPCFISDLYYADIYNTTSGEFSSWDTDNDGIFGEWYMNQPAEDNNIDLYPEVYVGRLPCKDTSQVKVVVNKIIKYETTAYGESWFKNIIGAAGDTYPDGPGFPEFPTPGYEGEINVGKILENMSNIGFNPTSLFVSDGSWSGPEDIRNAVNGGAGLMYFDGHSSPATWASKDDQKNWIQGMNLLNALLYSNMKKLPVMIWGGCHTFEFDVGWWNILLDPQYQIKGNYVSECLAWRFVRLPWGGAITAIGCTGLGLGKEDRDDCWKKNGTIPTEGCLDYLGPQFFFNYIEAGGSISGCDVLLGELMGNTVSDYLDNFSINWNQGATNDSADDAKSVQQWVLFGDPSLKIGGYPGGGGGSSEVQVSIANAQSSVNVYVGATVQFQASASGGTGSYAYQWQFEGGQLNYNTGKTAGCTWYSPGVYQATVKVTDTSGKECTYDTFVSVGIKPNAPSGPRSGKIGAEYTFTARITGSPSQDRICYFFDWGDDSFSDPIGPYTTKDQTVVEAKHVWNNPGQYQVRVKAWLMDSKNDLCEETGWSDPLLIDITGKVFDRTVVFQSMLQRLLYR